MRRAASSLFAALVLAATLPGGVGRAEPDPFPVGGAVVFRPASGTALHLAGEGAYQGSLEVVPATGGVSVLNELSLEEYVTGIAEVPGRWPMEALKAQAVAARTYGLWEMGRGYWQRFGFDLCGTTSCQVYRGAEAARGEEGRRWARAVRETAGEILVHEGEPILARYHASSGGQTLPNEVVYPDSGPRPYLRGVDDPADRVSPLHTWEVTFPRDHLESILGEGIELRGVLAGVEADPEAREVRIRTRGGELTLSGPRFRRVVSDVAPRLFPEDYPAPRPDGLPMPMTLPSSRFTVEALPHPEDASPPPEEADLPAAFRVSGRGYGHGVGMSQWGAKGRAEDGDDYREILAAYYGGLEPVRTDGPETVRVAVMRRVEEVRISGDGGFAVLAGDDPLSEGTLGSWEVEAGSDGTIRVRPPEGFEAPLAVTGLEVPEEVVHDPPDGEVVEVAFVLPKPAEVEGVLTSRDSDEVVGRADAVHEAGSAVLRIPLAGERLTDDGVYRLALEAFDGSDAVAEEAEVRIRKAGGSRLPVLVAGAFAALAALILWRRRQSSMTPVREQRSSGPHG